jgi:argonaute-like protein implicated in RNA metabolism and viral defense
MSSFSLYANIFEMPLLRFDYTLQTAVSRSPMKGISQFGPYDKNIFPKKEVSPAIVYPSVFGKAVKRFTESFIKGLGIYAGFRKWFRIDIGKFDEYSIKSLTSETYDDKLKEVVTKNYDIVFIIVEEETRSPQLYSLIKTILLGNGIPCQVIRSTTINAFDDQLQWILANIALSSYAKIGGTPWVINSREDAEIVLGMSRAMDKNKKVIVGFVTIFKHNGDFILIHSKSPVTTWEEYEKGLERLVYDAIREYEKKEGTPSSLVFHFHKRTGRKEIAAVKNAINKLNLDIKYALLHLNSYSNYRIFDPTDITYIPLTGLAVWMSSHQAILITDGRRQSSKRPYIGTPHVLEVTMDRESTMSFKEFPRLVEQVYRFSYVNWRGFNARTVPITINYPYLIARLVGNLEDVSKWNAIIMNGKLIDKAWFL